MRNRNRLAGVLGLLALAACSANAKAESPSEDGSNAIVVTFTDGQQKSFSAEEVERLEIKGPPTIVFRDGHHQTLDHEIVRIEFNSGVAVVGQNHFLGRWECGDGAGGHFFITLERGGVARKSVGSTGGRWKIVNGEARITWDDGWKDILRKVGNKHQKIAFRPGKSFSDEPSNTAAARNETAEPI